VVDVLFELHARNDDNDDIYSTTLITEVYGCMCVCVCTVSVPPTKQRLVAKYDYVANLDSPLGRNAEIDLHQLDKMSMIAPHPHQELWWFVEMDDGRRGYVPGNYVMVCHFD